MRENFYTQKLLFCISVVNKNENCAQLHVPANGYMTCDSMAFGYFCSPFCDEDHVRQADDVNHRLAHAYFCNKGKWMPDNVVGDCRSKTVDWSINQFLAKNVLAGACQYIFGQEPTDCGWYGFASVMWGFWVLLGWGSLYKHNNNNTGNKKVW